MKTSLALLLALVLSSCASAGKAPQRDLEAGLIDANRLPGSWQEDLEVATDVGGGFCDLPDTLEDSSPTTVAQRVLVDDETLLRHTAVRYSADNAADALETFLDRLNACGDDPESKELGLTVEMLPAPEETDAYRLLADVAGVPLGLDVAVWRNEDIVNILRLTYPRGSLEDPLATLLAAVAAAR